MTTPCAKTLIWSLVSITLFFVRNEIVPIIQDHSASKTPDLVTKDVK